MFQSCIKVTLCIVCKYIANCFWNGFRTQIIVYFFHTLYFFVYESSKCCAGFNDLIQINNDRMAIYGDAMSQLEEGYDNLRVFSL